LIEFGYFYFWNPSECIGKKRKERMKNHRAFISASSLDIEKVKGEEMYRVEKSGEDPF